MRIMHVITGLRQSGAETALYRLIMSDVENEHSVVSLGGLDYFGPILRKHGVNVVALRIRGVVSGLKALVCLRRLIRRRAPDLVQTWMYHADLIGGVVASLSTDVPVFWGVRRSNTSVHKWYTVTWLLLRVNSILSRLVPIRIICCARSAKDSHIKVGYCSKKMLVVPNGFDVEVIKPSISTRLGFRREMDVENGTVLFGAVGRWVPEKGYSDLLAALSLMHRSIGSSIQQLDLDRQQWLCLLVGHGLDQGNEVLMTEIAANGLDGLVIPVGVREDICAVMNGLDIHVLSSKGEGFPNVVGEAMSCGTPCVVTDVGDARDIVGDTGWVVPPSNIEALAHALTDAFSAATSCGWEQLSSECRDRIVGNYSIGKMCNSYRENWAACIANASDE